MRFFLAAKRTFCVMTLYALKIRALFFTARFVANLDDYKCTLVKTRQLHRMETRPPRTLDAVYLKEEDTTMETKSLDGLCGRRF